MGDIIPYIKTTSNRGILVIIALMVTITAVAAIVIAAKMGHPAQQPPERPWTDQLIPCPGEPIRYLCN